MSTDTNTRSQDHIPSEARVVINGRELTFGESMSLRVAVAGMISELAENPDALGTDDHARKMTQSYLRNLTSIQDTIRLGVK